MVDQDHTNLSPVAGIDGAGGVEDGDAVPEGEAAAWADVGFGADRKLEGEASGDEGAGVRGDELRCDRTQIHA